MYRLSDIVLPFLGALWLVCFFLMLHSVIEGSGYSTVLLERADTPGAYPRVVGLVSPSSQEAESLRLGDRVIEVAGTDLTGRGHVALYQPFHLAAERGDSSVPVRFARGAEIRSTEVPVGSYAIYWPRLPASLVFAVAAWMLARRARGSRVAHAFSMTNWVAGIFLACAFGGGPAVTAFSIGVHVASVALVMPLALHSALLFPHGKPPAGWLGRAPWAFALIGVFEASRFYEFPFSRPVGVTGTTAGEILFFAVLLIVATRRYWQADPIGRRRLKWVLLGTYLALVLPVTTTLLVLRDVELLPLVVVSMATLAIMPLSIVIAIVRYNLFDIDRLLNSTVATSLMLAAILGTILFAVPAAADVVSGWAGVAAPGAQLWLSVAVVALVVPTHSWVAARVERVLFPERFALAEGMHGLLGTLSAQEGADELAGRVGEQLVTLLNPETCVIYARHGEGFSPIFLHGRVAPPTFPVESALVATLGSHDAPLSAEATPLRMRGAVARPFERAVLDTLGVPVVVPIRRGDALVAFVCLGSKRSGDIYSATDLAMLAALMNALAAELERFDQDEMVRAARRMEENVRRYVPGALLDELDSGRDINEGETEVTVLFVDIRGYSQYAEGRTASEIFRTVNRYTRCVSETARRHGGHVVEFNGDGMMVLFGAPRPIADKEHAAAAAARAILPAVAALPLEDGTRLEVGIGIATGPAFVGNIQAADRMIWSAIGNTTNLAARLQELSRELDAAIVMDACTFERAGTEARGYARKAATVVRGRRDTVDLFALPLPGVPRGTAEEGAVSRALPGALDPHPVRGRA